MVPPRRPQRQPQVNQGWVNLPGNANQWNGVNAAMIPQGTQAIQPGGQPMAGGWSPMNNPQLPNMGMEAMPQVQNWGGVQLPGQTPNNLGGSLASILAGLAGGRPLQGQGARQPAQSFTRLSPGVYRDSKGRLVRR